MNLHSTNIASVGPMAWNRGGIHSTVSIKIHPQTPRPESSSVHVNPDTHAMPEARGDYREHHLGSML